MVGHLQSGGRTFGYEVTTFRLSHVQVPGMNSAVSLYRTDIAITDEARKRFLQRVTYYFPQSVSVSQTTLALRVGTVTLRGDSPRDMTLRASIPRSSLTLRLASQRSPMYVGGRGYMQMADGFTYYYSLTDLATSGTLVVAGKRYAVTGVSWLDHQWGNWTWSTVKGWTWMALQLNNGVQLSIFDFHSTVSRVRAASVLLANGQLRTIGAITISSLGSWRSPHTGGVYPSGWIVRIPALRATFHVTPSVLDQEVTSPGVLRASYWEGSGRIQGTYQGAAVSGLSYTELTGYAGTAPTR